VIETSDCVGEYTRAIETKVGIIRFDEILLTPKIHLVRLNSNLPPRFTPPSSEGGFLISNRIKISILCVYELLSIILSFKSLYRLGKMNFKNFGPNHEILNTAVQGIDPYRISTPIGYFVSLSLTKSAQSGFDP